MKNDNTASKNLGPKPMRKIFRTFAYTPSYRTIDQIATRLLGHATCEFIRLSHMLITEEQLDGAEGVILIVLLTKKEELASFNSVLKYLYSQFPPEYIKLIILSPGNLVELKVLKRNNPHIELLEGFISGIALQSSVIKSIDFLSSKSTAESLQRSGSAIIIKGKKATPALGRHKAPEAKAWNAPTPVPGAKPNPGPAVTPPPSIEAKAPVASPKPQVSPKPQASSGTVSKKSSFIPVKSPAARLSILEEWSNNKDPGLVWIPESSDFVKAVRFEYKSKDSSAERGFPWPGP